MGVPIGSILEVSFIATVNNQRLLNLIHYRNTAVDANATLDGEYNDIFAKINSGGTQDLVTPYRDCVSNQVTLEALRLQFVYLQRRRGLTFNIIGAQGSRAGNCTAQNVQATIVKQGDTANRHNTGAFRMGGLSATDYVAGMLTNPLVGVLGTFANAIRTSFVTAGGGSWRPIIRNRITQQWQNAWADFDNVAVKREVRTQRTRTVGRGE